MTDNSAPTEYERLVERLLDLQQREPSPDPLAAASEALIAVLRFLAADPRLRGTTASRPLWQLFFAILDRQQGAKPELFFDLPDRRGRPIRASAIMFKEYANYALSILLAAGLDRDRASSWIATELKRAGVKYPGDGQFVDARTIARWGYELGPKSETVAEISRATVKNLAIDGTLDAPTPTSAANRPLLSAEDANVAAKFFLGVLKTAGF
jgi:hypothetical protein